MNQRTAGIAGIAAVSLAAIGLLAPAAAASPVNLAPGVQCDTIRCQNNTNQTYRIDWTAACVYAETNIDPIAVPEHTWIAPHETIDLVEGINNAYCPPQSSDHGPSIGELDPGSVASAQFIGAAVDSSRPPPPPSPWSGTG